ncbi:MAG: hypothetical protein HFJ06_05540 [Lachnospiraceae bacterium]|nr:hypothetical protein [Lachnospiraceae bacterium]
MKKYTIIQHIADISKMNNGWTKECNIVTWANREPVYELRSWNADHTKMGKGITLTPNELRKLKDVLNNMDLRCMTVDMYYEDEELEK